MSDDDYGDYEDDHDDKAATGEWVGVQMSRETRPDSEGQGRHGPDIFRKIHLFIVFFSLSKTCLAEVLQRLSVHYKVRSYIPEVEVKHNALIQW